MSNFFLSFFPQHLSVQNKWLSQKNVCLILMLKMFLFWDGKSKIILYVPVVFTLSWLMASSIK